MRLVVDTSALAGELLRATGRQRLGDERLDLFLAEQTWNETRIELPRKIGTITPAHKPEPAEADHLVDVAIAAVDASPTELDEAVYAAAETRQEQRCQRDPTGLAGRRLRPLLNAGIWTNDNDFLGGGVPTWTTASPAPATTPRPSSTPYKPHPRSTTVAAAFPNHRFAIRSGRWSHPLS